MSNRRLIRVGEAVRAELGRLISRERSLEGDLITITSVEVTPDLRQAFVYCTTLNQQLQEDEMLSKLDALRSEWQREINSRMRIKYTPKLTFRVDEAQKRGDRVIQILDEL